MFVLFIECDASENVMMLDRFSVKNDLSKPPTKFNNLTCDKTKFCAEMWRKKSFQEAVKGNGNCTDRYSCGIR